MQEENNDDTQFEILLEKLMSYQVGRVCWSQTMDLLALVTLDNVLELIRISYKAQKVFQVEEKEPITALTFSPDSLFLIYGCLDGSIKMLKTEDAEKVLVSQRYHQSSVENINWVPYHRTRAQLFSPFKKDSMETKLLLQVSPHASCDRNSISKLKYLNELRDDFTLLLTSQRNKTYLNLNGFIPILSLDYKQTSLQDFSVVYSTYHGKIYSILGYQKLETMDLYLATYDCQELEANKEDVIAVNYLMAHIGELFTFVQSSYVAIGNQVRDILRQYNNKINLLDDPNAASPVSPSEDLLKFLNTGVASQPLMQFLTKELYDTKFLQKMDQTLTTLFGNLQDLALQSTQNVLERLTLLLKRLTSLCSVEKFELFGLNAIHLKKFEEQIKELYWAGELLLNTSTEIKFDIRNFLVWLNKITIKSQESEAQTENIKSYLNKYTVDIGRLREFLKDESRFRLKGLQQILNGKFQHTNFSEKYKTVENKKKQEQEFQQQRKIIYDRIEYELGLSNLVDIHQAGHQPAQIRRNINEIAKAANELWKAIIHIPNKRMNQLVIKKHTCKLIGTVKSSDDFEPIVRVYDRKDKLYVYYIEEHNGFNYLSRYDIIHNKTQRMRSQMLILDIAVNRQNILVLLQGSDGNQLGMLTDMKETMEFEKVMRVEASDCRIDSSDRGLSSILLDKNKLMIV